MSVGNVAFAHDLLSVLCFDLRFLQGNTQPTSETSTAASNYTVSGTWSAWKEVLASIIYLELLLNSQRLPPRPYSCC